MDAQAQSLSRDFPSFPQLIVAPARPFELRMASYFCEAEEPPPAPAAGAPAALPPAPVTMSVPMPPKPPPSPKRSTKKQNSFKQAGVVAAKHATLSNPRPHPEHDPNAPDLIAFAAVEFICFEFDPLG